MSLAAALLQALVAVALVGAAAALLHATAATMSLYARSVELTSYAAVAALGTALLWRKTGALLAALGPDQHRGAAAQACCDHAHLPTPEETERIARWREAAGVVLAAGIRPCAGAIIVLVFAL